MHETINVFMKFFTLSISILHCFPEQYYHLPVLNMFSIPLFNISSSDYVSV